MDTLKSLSNQYIIVVFTVAVFWLGYNEIRFLQLGLLVAIYCDAKSSQEDNFDIIGRQHQYRTRKTGSSAVSCTSSTLSLVALVTYGVL